MTEEQAQKLIDLGERQADALERLADRLAPAKPDPAEERERHDQRRQARQARAAEAEARLKARQEAEADDETTKEG